MPATSRATTSSAQGSGSSSMKQEPEPKAPHAAIITITELCHDALLLILGFISTARDVGRCAAVNQAWRGAANDAGLWKQIVQLERLALAATVFPLINRRLPPPGMVGDGDGGANGRLLHPYHPKRLLEKHWRVARYREDEDADSSDVGGRASATATYSWAHLPDVI